MDSFLRHEHTQLTYYNILLSDMPTMADFIKFKLLDSSINKCSCDVCTDLYFNVLRLFSTSHPFRHSV